MFKHLRKCAFIILSGLASIAQAQVASCNTFDISSVSCSSAFSITVLPGTVMPSLTLSVSSAASDGWFFRSTGDSHLDSIDLGVSFTTPNGSMGVARTKTIDTPANNVFTFYDPTDLTHLTLKPVTQGTYNFVYSLSGANVLTVGSGPLAIAFTAAPTLDVVPTSPIPESKTSTLALAGLGLMVVRLYRRKPKANRSWLTFALRPAGIRPA